MAGTTTQQQSGSQSQQQSQQQSQFQSQEVVVGAEGGSASASASQTTTIEVGGGGSSHYRARGYYGVTSVLDNLESLQIQAAGTKEVKSRYADYGVVEPLSLPVESTPQRSVCPATEESISPSKAFQFPWRSADKLKPGEEGELKAYVSRALEGFDPKCEKAVIQIEGRRCNNKGERNLESLDEARAEKVAELVREQVGDVPGIEVRISSKEGLNSSHHNMQDPNNASAVLTVVRTPLTASN